MKSRALAALTLAPSLLLAACGSSLTVETFEPPRLDIGPAEVLVLTDGYGRAEALFEVAGAVREHSASDGYFRLDDRVGTRGRLELDGSSAVLPDAPGREDALYLRIDVLEHYAYDERVTEDAVDAEGATVLVERDVVHAVSLLSASVARADGAVLLAEREYEGVFTGDLSAAGYDAALREATRAAVRAILDEVTPRRVRESIPLDESVEAHAPVLQAAEQGQLDFAIAEMEAFVAEHPEVAAGHYNLAAFYDAAGAYEVALDGYEVALSLGGPSYTARVRGECLRRLERARVLGLR